MKGGCYFFTVVTAQRHSNQILTENIDLLREAFRSVQTNHPFKMDAVVILPEHLHCIWQLPASSNDFSTRWRLIKSTFSRAISKEGERISQSRQKKKERNIWQRRFWEHCIRDEKDYQNHVDYIHYNPVKHGCVKHVSDWPYSSFQHWVDKGLYPANWAASDEIKELDFEKSYQ